MKKSFQLFIIPLLFIPHLAKAQSLLDSLVNTDTIYSIIEKLSSDSLKGRLTGTKENLESATYITRKFEEFGLKKVQGLDGYYEKIDSLNYNIIGLLKGKSKSNELVIFSAHYDHIGTLKTNPYPFFKRDKEAEKYDTIFNGANDNASGVSALITLAKYFSITNNNERSIMFIAFTGEEVGLLGSKFSASQVDENAVVAMLNFDMIGRNYSNKKNPFITGSEYSNLIDILNRNLKKYDLKKYGRSFIERDPFIYANLFWRSDNIPFVFRRIPAHTISATSPDDEFYHHLKDEIQTIDCNLIAEIIKASIIGTSTIVDATEKSTRINDYFFRKR